MPGRVKVRVVAGRNLPVMDRTNETTDAYVEVRFGSTTYKTEVCRKSLCPQWNSEWFRFEVDDTSLQDEPLQIRVMDHDTYSANDAIGKVYIDLNPLLLPSFTRSVQENEGNYVSGGAVVSGWIPIYDTIHGLRGEINVVVKVDFISNFNKYRKSSCGVQIFYAPNVPCGYTLASVHGFVEELVVNDDPEYQWIDKIRTPRASNEARQVLFCKLSGEVQRRIGLKALELGGNAILGYKVCFDLEGESGVVVRGIGTSVTMCRTLGGGAGGELALEVPGSSFGSSFSTKEFPFVEDEAGGAALSTSPARLSPRPSFHGRQAGVQQAPVRKTSSSAVGPAAAVAAAAAATAAASQPPTSPGRSRSGVELRAVKSGEGDGKGDQSHLMKYGQAGPGTKPAAQQRVTNGETLEYPFLTMSRYPDHFILKLGGTVSSRSVKLLDRIHNPDEPETRDAWWTELRMEIRSHAKALACNVVLGYEEKTSIWEEICILSASGTAALVAGVQFTDPAMLTYGIVGYPMPNQSHGGAERKDSFRSTSSAGDSNEDSQELGAEAEKECQPSSVPLENSPCSMCHVPYGDYGSPFPVNLKRCQICWSGRVPDSLLMTIEPPNRAPRVGKCTLIQGRVSRPVKDCKGEQLAKEVSDSLPFLEYEMYRQLINKLRVKGMNCIAGLRTQISIGDKILIGVATGTACYFASLPPPTVPKILSSHPASNLSVDGESSVGDVQKKLCELVAANRKTFGLANLSELIEAPKAPAERMARLSESEDEPLPHLDFSAGNKDTCVLEIDDCEDLDVINLLMDPKPPLNFEVSNIEDDLDDARKPVSDSASSSVGADGNGNGDGNNGNGVGPGPGQTSTTEAPLNQLLTKIWRGPVPQPFTSKDLSGIMDRLIHGACYRFRKAEPKSIRMLRVNVVSLDEDDLQIILTGVCLGTPVFSYSDTWKKCSTASNEPSTVSDVETVLSRRASASASASGSTLKANSHGLLEVPDAETKSDRTSVVSRSLGLLELPTPVIITPLSWIQGRRAESYLGNLNFFFIRETMNVKDCGGLSVFISSFVAEVLSIVRAHVRALGGNALMSYSMSECGLMHSPHKSQAQCLINVNGDVVKTVELARCS